MKPPITNDLAEAARFITEGRVVAVPTGTSYGLAVDALQGNALQRVRNLKGRSPEKTFTVMVRSDLIDTFFDLSDEERDFMHAHENQAFTILLKTNESLEHLAQDGRVGLRLVDHPLTAQLLEQLDVPITATSANIAGEDPCFDPAAVQETFPWIVSEEKEPEVVRTGPTTYDTSLACILDGGSLPSTAASTIVIYESGDWNVIREGAGKL